MSSVTPISALPYPSGSDVPNVPVDIAALANALDVLQPCAFRRTRTAGLSLSGGVLSPLIAWPSLDYSKGNFGTFAGGIWTFTVPGLYRWSCSVTWPNGTAYKGQAELLINGVVSPDGDNIDAKEITTTGAPPVMTHVGEYQVEVGDTWQVALASSTDQVGVIPHSWTVAKIG